MNKTDLRYINAESRIITAFYQLLRKQKFSEIKTKEIIEAAEINKSTFYSHYLDKYDLLDQLEDRFIDGLYNITSNLPDDILTRSNSTEMSDYYLALAGYFYSCRDELVLLLNEDTYSNITLKIASHIESIWESKGLPFTGSTINTYYVSAFSHMISGILIKWVRANCSEPIEDFAAIVQKLGDNIRKALL